MTLLQKLLNDKANEEMRPKGITTVESEQATLAGLSSATPLRNAAKGSPNVTHANVVKMEKHFGYSFEELIATYKETKK